MSVRSVIIGDTIQFYRVVYFFSGSFDLVRSRKTVHGTALRVPDKNCHLHCIDLIDTRLAARLLPRHDQLRTTPPFYHM